MLIAGSAVFWFPEEMCGSLAQGSGPLQMAPARGLHDCGLDAADHSTSARVDIQHDGAANFTQACPHGNKARCGWALCRDQTE